MPELDTVPEGGLRDTGRVRTVRSDDTRAVGWWRALSCPWGVFWSEVASAPVALALGVVLLIGDSNDVYGACCLLVALVNGARAAGLWQELRGGKTPGPDEDSGR